jgi:hypothetical protein
VKVALPALLLLLANQAGAQSFVSMGRLFTTPGERVQLDTQRNQAPAAAAAQAGTAAAPVGQGGGAIASGMDASEGCPPGAAPGCLPAGAGTTAGAGAGASLPPATEAPEAPGLRLDGIIRRSGGGTVLIVNGEVQPAPHGMAPGGTVRGGVTLQADGRAVVLKPGQRFDPATGVIHEAAR